MDNQAPVNKYEPLRGFCQNCGFTLILGDTERLDKEMRTHMMAHFEPRPFEDNTEGDN